MDFHSQKDLFNNHRHQAIRNLFIEKRKLLGLSQNELAAQMQTDVSSIIHRSLILEILSLLIFNFLVTL